MKFDLSQLKNIPQSILEHSYIHAGIEWTKTHSLPGFFHVPLYDVVIFLYNETKRFALATRANSMAFSFFLALFPSIIFLFSLATHLPLYETFAGEINQYIDKIMPTDAGEQVKEAIKRIDQSDSRILSLGFILALFFASNGMMAMMRSFEKSHLSVFEKRGGVRKRLISIALTIQLGFLLIASVVLIVLGDWLINLLADWVNLTNLGKLGIILFRWLVTILLFYSGIAILYRYGASMANRLRFFSPGTTLATILCIISSLGFSFYVENFGSYQKVYGSIGTIIVLMLWIQINAFILLVGFELNASIAVNRDLKEEIKEDE